MLHSLTKRSSVHGVIFCPEIWAISYSHKGPHRHVNAYTYVRPSPPKIQGCRIDQQIQRWLKDQLQDSIANKGMAWPSRHATTIRHNIEIFQVILSNLMFR